MSALRTRRVSWSAVLPPLVALAPFVIGLIALRGLTADLATFHASDELQHHYPTILQFARQLPAPDLVHYPAAQTPLYHLLEALWAKVVGTGLAPLRVLTWLISCGAVLLAFVLLRRRDWEPWPAAVLAGLVGLSPYFFAPAFLLLTDNLAVGLAVLVLILLDRFRRRPSWGWLLGAAVAAGAAVLTRQSSLWLPALVASVALVTPWGSWGRRVSGVLVAGAAVIPFVALVIAWKGLIPPTGDPSSCGLCSGGATAARHGLDRVFVMRAALFGLGVLGLYAAAVVWPVVLDIVRGHQRRPGLSRRYAVTIAAAVLALLLFPVHREGALDAGYLWRASSWFPDVFGTSLLLWVLIPFGACALVACVARYRTDPVAALGIAWFAISTLGFKLQFEKYYEPIYPLLGLLAVSPVAARDRRHLVTCAVIAVASVAYTLSFVV